MINATLINAAKAEVAKQSRKWKASKGKDKTAQAAMDKAGQKLQELTAAEAAGVSIPIPAPLKRVVVPAPKKVSAAPKKEGN